MSDEEGNSTEYTVIISKAESDASIDKIYVSKEDTDIDAKLQDDGTYLDNSCKVLGNNQYSICPADFTDTGYSCSKKEEIEATKK